MRDRLFGVSMLTLSLFGLACGKSQDDGPGVAGSSTGAQSGAGGADSGAGTGAGAAGAGGGEQLPPEEVPPATSLTKLDLLLMVDNSLNTLEKQRLLLDAVEWLLAPPGDVAPLGTADVHVGVITSSLGSHGATAGPGMQIICERPEHDDHARLLGSVRPGLGSYKNSGFLAWGPDAEASQTPAALVDGLRPMFDVIGEQGCGYEASLEAWYRFLVDPEPPESVVVSQSSPGVLQGVDQVVLEQRARFLRPDSVLAIVTLSDENDCSIVDEGYGWLLARTTPMFRGTSACAADPNDPCCQSCSVAAARPGCPAIADDPVCAGDMRNLTSSEDSLNLRCWDQKRRFGVDLLYPIRRYTEALTRQTQLNRAGEAVANPIFAGGMRHPSQVVYTGIVGVPWQDLADQASLSGPGLTYLTAAELTAQNRWDVVLGDPDASPPRPPTDPFMLETTQDRTELASAQAHPLLPNVALVPSSSTDPQANPINGHEFVDARRDMLQFACTFPLQTPKPCDSFEATRGCLCYAEDLERNMSLCRPPGGGAVGTTQYYDDAFPGIRHLQLLKSLGDSAVTASVCPKVVEPASADYGYRPAMRALKARLERAFNP